LAHCCSSTNQITFERRAAGVCGAPTAGPAIGEVELFDRVREIAHEVAAPEFAVRGDLESEFLLSDEHAKDCCVFSLPQLFGVAGFSRLEQLGEPRKLST